MKKKHLTLSEIVIIVAVLGILVTIGIPLYNNTIENAKAKACELNLKTILGAIEAQTLERDSFPATLSQISDKNFEEARVEVLKEEGAFKAKLIYFLANLDKNGVLYAATVASKPWIRNFIADANVLRCPGLSDDVPFDSVSYGINSTLSGTTYDDYKAVPENTLIVGDCSRDKFASPAELEARHKEYKLFQTTKYAITVDKGKQKVRVSEDGVPAAAAKGGDDEQGKAADGDKAKGDQKSKGSDKGKDGDSGKSKSKGDGD